MMENSGNNQVGQNNATGTQDAAATNNDPFAASTGAMFNDFQRVAASAEEQKNNASGINNPANSGADLPPGMGEADLNNLEKQFMGMFQNIAKQMENMEQEDDDEDDDDLTEEEKKEAEAMMKNIFGAMGVDSSQMNNPMMPGAMGSNMPNMQPPNEEEFAAQMRGFEEMFKSMGMQMNDENPTSGGNGGGGPTDANQK